MKIRYSLILLLAIFITGCSKKSEVEYNKPAIYWYKKIIKNVTSNDLDSADEHFTSLSSEHINSIFLKESMLILAQAHIEDEEYLLAKFYLDEYIKKFGDKESIEFAKFLKIKASFFAFKYPFRDQELLYSTLEEAFSFKEVYPDSIYTPFVDMIVTRVNLAINNLNREIAGLYGRMEKPEAEAKYLEKLKDSQFQNLNTIQPETSWYRAVFE